MRICEMLLLSSGRQLTYYKNAEVQKPGIVLQNIEGMEPDAERLKNDSWAGGIILDEMAIQEDIQVVERCAAWESIGLVEKGLLNDCLCVISNGIKDRRLARQNIVRWRAFHTKIAVQPSTIKDVVMACCVQHNLIQEKTELLQTQLALLLNN